MPSVADLTAKYYSKGGTHGSARPLLLLIIVIMPDAQKFLVFGFAQVSKFSVFQDPEFGATRCLLIPGLEL